MRFHFIRAHTGEFRVRTMCRVLAVSRAGYYAWCARPVSVRARTDAMLATRLRVLHAGSRRTYGSPRLHAELRAEGVACGRHRVARVMRQLGLAATPPRRFRVTTDSAHAAPIVPNQLARDFTVGPANQRWAADLTYLPTAEGWAYLAVVLDLGSRRVVGWAFGDRLVGALPRTALDRALTRRRPAAGLLHHSDRGAQYAAYAYQALLGAHGGTPSMSRRGDCWDNAVVESFFATLKKECVRHEIYATRAVAHAALGDYIEGWYNKRRRHSALGYLSPEAYEAAQQKARVA